MLTFRPSRRATASAHHSSGPDSAGVGRTLAHAALPLTAILFVIGCRDESKCGREHYTCSGLDLALDAGPDAAVDGGSHEETSIVSPDSETTTGGDRTFVAPESTNPGPTGGSRTNEEGASSIRLTDSHVVDAGNTAAAELSEAGASNTAEQSGVDTATSGDIDASATSVEISSGGADLDRSTSGQLGGGGNWTSDDTTTSDDSASANATAIDNLYPDGSATDASSHPVDGGAPLVLECDGGARDTIPIDAFGVVSAECKDGIQGSWYCYDDGVNPSGCTPDVVPFDAEESGLCLSGYTTVDFEYLAWGAGIGLTLNDSPRGSRPWNAVARNIVGFTFNVTGDAGELPLRVNFTNSADFGVTPPSILLPGTGQYEVYFADARVPDWAGQNPGDETDATAIYDVQVMVVGAEASDSYDICLTRLSPIYGD
jgi:hypothetical protein